jgi:hypothetical protein
MVALPYNNVITSISSLGSGYYVPPSTLGVLPRGSAALHPSGGPRGFREGRNTPYPSLEIDVMYQYAAKSTHHFWLRLHEIRWTIYGAAVAPDEVER